VKGIAASAVVISTLVLSYTLPGWGILVLLVLIAALIEVMREHYEGRIRELMNEHARQLRGE